MGSFGLDSTVRSSLAFRALNLVRVSPGKKGNWESLMEGIFFLGLVGTLGLLLGSDG